MLQPRGDRSTAVDAATVLTVYLVLLLAIPAPLVVPALGTAGSPATIVSIIAFMWWVWFHVQRAYSIDLGFQPLRIAVLVLLLVVIAAYVHAMSGPMPADELTPADSGVLKMLGLAGLALIATEGVPTLDRTRTVARRLAIGAGLVALLGIAQFSTQQVFVDMISIPGLSARGAEFVLAERNGFTRLSGTSTHPIEYGVVLTMALPILVVHAMHSPTRRWLYRGLLLAVAITVFLVISRSAILCASVALIVLALRWSWRQRLVGIGAALAVLTIVYVSIPGILGTLTALFVEADEDSSVASRTGSYSVAFQFIARSPWFGRGSGTFLPQYWILDNQYLAHFIETGIIGLVALLAVILVAAATARRAREQALTDFDAELAHGVLAAVVAGAAAMAFYDLFAFPQSSGCFFLIIGLAGSLARLTALQRRERTLGARSVGPS